MAPLQTVTKTIAVLEALLKVDQDRVGVTEIAEELGWSRAATHQYLSSLAAAGWLQQDASRKYVLTSQAAIFGRFAVRHAGVPPELPPVMRELVQELSEPISFAVVSGAEAVIVERQEPQRPFAIHRDAERHLSLHTSASGLVLLAFDAHLEYRGSEDELGASLEAVRAQGHCHRHSKWMGDVVDAVAVPIMARGNCLGALSVIAPEKRMDVPRAIEALTAARARVEEAIATRGGTVRAGRLG